MKYEKYLENEKKKKKKKKKKQPPHYRNSIKIL
jgi:hypothetical protein